MRIAVAGGTGVVGRFVVGAVHAAGHEPVVLTRSTGVDLTTGSGLDDALQDVAAVIDASNVTTTSRRKAIAFFDTATTNLLAAGERAGVRHHVALSIVGVDRVGFGYYAGKLHQEELALAGPMPASVLRATQFHEFAAQMLEHGGPFALAPKMLSQPVAAREVAAALLEIALGEPVGMAPELAGPEQLQMAELVRRLVRVRGRRRIVVPLRLPGAAGKAMATGGLLPTGPGPRGTQTFEQWLGVNGRPAELATAYERARPRLIRLAYAVLGTHAEAEDVVSERGLRLAAADARDRILDVDAWASVTVARAALDTLRSARLRREVYVGPWLPEPTVDTAPPALDPADRVTLDDSVSYALLVALESLTPAERTAWVLHDLFGMSFTDVAETVGRTPAAARQLAVRARAHVGARAPRVAVGAAEHSATVSAFLEAAVGGDLSLLVQALDPDVVATSDGGGQVTAARRPVIGAEPVARFLQGIVTMVKDTEHLQVITVNGEPGVGVFDGDTPTTVVSLTVADARIVRIDIIRAPAKLAGAVRVRR